MSSVKLNLLLGLWNGPTMMGAYYERALRKEHTVFTVGPHFEDAESDFDARPGDPLKEVLSKIEPPIDFYVQFYSKPDYFPPDLHEIDLPKAWYVYDLHLHLDEIAASCYLFDIIFTYDELSKRELERRGVPRVEVLLFAADPELYYQKHQKKERKYDVGFSGSAWGSDALKGRESLLKKVGDQFNLKVEHRTLMGKAVADFYQDCHIVLNHAIKNDLNMRISEVLLSGRPLLTPDVPGLRTMIEPDKHAIIYRENNVLDQIALMLEQKDKMEVMAQQGQEHALANMTYAKRAKSLATFLEEELHSYTHNGRASKNPYLSKAAQFNYHYFRFPGDAFIWLRNTINKKDGNIIKILVVSLNLMIFTLYLLQKIKKNEYFQQKNWKRSHD
jgi:hypothetical protein